MCGIAGYIDFSKTLGEDHLKPMCDALTHRGPDAEGRTVHLHPNAHIGLGHRRLSILDLSAEGIQPMEKNGISIVFNGEIYNFNEIKTELESYGAKFKSRTDTEVIIEAYREWGMSCLTKFKGMFAFALYDERKEKVYVVRDRVGVKPLFVYHKGQHILFGSELKCFHESPVFEKELDHTALSLFLKLSYIPTPYCIFKHTQKVKPGHILEINLNKQSIVEKKYWDVVDAYNAPPLDLSYAEAVDELERLLRKNFMYRMVADVPVGVFLSGGYDSAAVASIIQDQTSSPIKTFTVGFNEVDFDEAKDAEKIAKHIGSEHYTLTCTPENASDIFHKIPQVYDEPFADNSVVPTMLVSKFAKQEVKVALSGDGGDEIFGGYNKFKQALDFTQRYPHLLQTVLGKAMSLIDPESLPILRNTHNFSSRYEKMINIWMSHSPFVALKNISYYITDEEVKKILNVPFDSPTTFFDIEGKLAPHNDYLNKLLAIDYKTFLMDNNMVKIDRASMSVGLEGREPFLDQEIIEFAARLPSHYKIRSGYTKSMLKHVTHRYIDPALMDRPKKPFIAPLKEWFKDDMRGLMMDYINKETLDQQEIFNTKEVLAMRDKYLQDRGVGHQKVWNILLFQLWYKAYM
ncbi:asparagine synthase (glutamine-hydrolyzing) [Luteibaculum oceani]|uniref:asparagine synthase (glutamine-hydrolyzing) n=1 Tax=Luteibaculum oceani TaxID=1294296 RepID=A0A5C6USY7_9FLAO|nr:asparagine synthase (glutamine-hydrolyzing) [Luteibaculum oceani]TXC76099.1 asparagine synthase (glutamine-hydrolyzing) [Luteibaculum oceani]